MSSNPTPYPEVNTVLEQFASGVITILGEQLVGIYLHGSLANGDFNPARSDIDFLVATEAELPAEMVAALTAMHAALFASGSKWAQKLEGFYTSLATLRRYDPSNLPHPILHMDGTIGMEPDSIDWILQRHVLREKGVVICGPDLKTLIEPVSAAELRRSARGILTEWWEPMLTDPWRLRDGEYQAYAVLTMCRILYTLKNAEVATKSEAVRWAKQELELRWQGLIEQAFAWPQPPQPERLPETLELIRYTLEESQK